MHDRNNLFSGSIIFEHVIVVSVDHMSVFLLYCNFILMQIQDLTWHLKITLLRLVQPKAEKEIWA